MQEHKIERYSDFNDLHCLEGLDEVRRQIERALHSGDCNRILPGESEGKEPGGQGNNQNPIQDDLQPKADNNQDGRDESGKKKSKGKKGPSQEEIETLGKEILDCRFKLFVDSQKTILYNITDKKRWEVEICENEDFILRRTKIHLEELIGRVPDENLVKRVYGTWKLGTKHLKQEPKSFAWADEAAEVYSFKRLSFVPCEGNHDSWKEFIYRLSAPDDFMAFVWSIFEIKNRSRQILYLYDPVGETGKSTVIRALGWVFGNSFSAINNTMVSGAGNRWLLGQLYGKRLIAWADCKNPKFCMSETARNISSGDPVPIEFKGGHPFQAEMYAKLILGSNHEPEITSGGADTSRLMVIKVEENKINKDDPDWEKRLRDELPHFLWECKKHYEEKCLKHGKISLSKETITRVCEASESFEAKWEDIVERRIILKKGEEMPVTDWMKLCREEKLDNHDIGNFKEYLRRIPGVFIGKKRDHGPQKMKYEGFKLRPSIWTASAPTAHYDSRRQRELNT